MTKPPALTFTISSEMKSQIQFTLACALDDWEKELKTDERRRDKRNDASRALHARLQRWLLIEFNPSALCGELVLLDGTKIAPKG